MMYVSAELLTLWAFVGGITFIALLTVILALVWRWAAPSADVRSTQAR